MDYNRNVESMYGIIANVLFDDTLRKGAKVHLLFSHGGAENCKVIGLSVHGRQIEKYIAFKKLSNYRAVWLPNHLWGKTELKYTTKEEAEKVANTLDNMWKGIRVFDKDGNIIKEGLPAGSAFKKEQIQD